MDNAAETWVEQPEEQTLAEGAGDCDDRPEFLVGTGQIGPYLLERELGRGMNGAVYLARREGLARKFAIKVLLNASPEAAERFQREARVVGRIDDPGVVGVVDVGKHRGRPYLAMDYVDGPSLQERLRLGPLPALEAAKLIADLARTMAHAHERGVLHRDLKPANILLDERAGVTIPRVTDFGLARDGPGKRITNSEDILGTPHYMAPEQTEGALLATLRTDVYALGAILHECLTGNTPFRSTGSFLELFETIRTKEPPTLQSLGLPMPEALASALQDVCSRAMAKDPNDRYATAALLAKDLDQVLDGESTPPEPASDRVWTLIWILAGLAAGLALGVPLGYSARSQAAGPALGVRPAPAAPPPPSRATGGEPRISDDALAHHEAGEQAERRGDLKAAIAAYTKAIERSPRFAFAYLRRGRAYARLNDREQAIANHSRALAIDPTYTEAWFERGICKEEGGDLPGALADYVKALQQNPSHGLALMHRGRVRHLQGELSRALEDYSSASKLLKSDSEATLQLEAWSSDATKSLSTLPR